MSIVSLLLFWRHRPQAPLSCPLSAAPSRSIHVPGIVLLGALLAGCSQTPSKPGIGQPVCWNQLPGWQQDDHQHTLTALLAQCPRLSSKQTAWQAICNAAPDPQTASGSQLQRFFEGQFTPHVIRDAKGSHQGLITGYYEPILQGSFVADETYHYPLYQRPEQMLKIDLSSRFSTLKNQRVRGLLVDNTVIPFYSRAQIDGPEQPLKGQELLWVSDPDAAFFLHIQGSGRVRLANGELVAVGYADQNGQPYVSIGKRLIEQGELEAGKVSMQSIRTWLQSHPAQANALKNQNPSYVFFRLRNDPENGPRGSLNVPLTPERSIAVDRRVIPLGTPVWLSTTLPGASQPYQRLVFAQDTGGAINGPVRADLFFGHGERAEYLAGHMQQAGQLFALLPKQPGDSCP